MDISVYAYYKWSGLEGKKIAIKILHELYQGLKQMIAGTGFSNVNEFTVFVRRNIASSGESSGEERLTVEEVRSIRERLKRLGYLKAE